MDLSTFLSPSLLQNAAVLTVILAFVSYLATFLSARVLARRKDKLELVFEKFKQLEGGQKSAGYGLGLSICKKIVELHGGRIWVESDTGQGSRFIFRLPLQGPAADRAVNPPAA